MSGLTLQLPPRQDQAEFNLRRWEELLLDPTLAGLPHRIETDRHGHVLMSPPPSRQHGSLQSEISFRLRTLMKGGETVTECPISTPDGVKAADVVWLSAALSSHTAGETCLSTAPEICVEILSPSNSNGEMAEKSALYFAAGAKEVWLCTPDGSMTFSTPAGPMPHSRLCPDFPRQIAAIHPQSGSGNG